MQTQENSRWLKLAVLGFLIPLTAGSVASASLILKVNATTVTDQGAGDLNPLPDGITFVQSTADYTVDIQIGTSNDPGTSQKGILSINSTITRTSSAGSKLLKITLTDNGYTLPVSNHYTLTSIFSGSLTARSSTASETFQSTISSPSHSDPSQGFSVLGTALSPKNLPISSNNTNSVNFFPPLSHPYTLQEVANITLGPSASARLIGQTILTPEPATLGVLGISAIGLLRRRRI